MGTREERLGANEALFREVNERVAEAAQQFVEVGESPINFSCECGDKACAEQIAMTVGEYEAVRSEATHFAVVPGHEVPDIERVVSRLAMRPNSTVRSNIRPSVVKNCRPTA